MSMDGCELPGIEESNSGNLVQLRAAEPPGVISHRLVFRYLLHARWRRRIPDIRRLDGLGNIQTCQAVLNVRVSRVQSTFGFELIGRISRPGVVRCGWFTLKFTASLACVSESSIIAKARSP